MISIFSITQSMHNKNKIKDLNTFDPNKKNTHQIVKLIQGFAASLN